MRAVEGASQSGAVKVEEKSRFSNSSHRSKTYPSYPWVISWVFGRSTHRISTECIFSHIIVLVKTCLVAFFPLHYKDDFSRYTWRNARDQRVVLLPWQCLLGLAAHLVKREIPLSLRRLRFASWAQFFFITLTSRMHLSAVRTSRYFLSPFDFLRSLC